MKVFIAVGPEQEFIAVGGTLDEAVDGIAEYEGSHPGSLDFRQKSDTLWLDPVAPEYSILLRTIKE